MGLLAHQSLIMKIRIDQLTGQLKKQLAPIYIVSGDEPLLQQEACDAIRAAAKKQGFEEREVFHAEANFDWNSFSAEANSLSLFASRKILEVRLPNGKPSDKGEALKAYTIQPSDDNILILITNKLDSAVQRAKWFKTIEAASIWLPIWPIESRQLAGWINQRLKKAGLQASPDAAQMLADRVEGNLLAAVQEIEKLKLLSDKPVLDINDIQQLVADQARYDLFNFVDNVLAGKAQVCLRMLNGLHAEGTEPTILLWALTRELRTLAAIAAEVKTGKNIEVAFKQERIWDKKKPFFKAALKRLPLYRIEGLLSLSHQIDLSIKGMSYSDPWLLLRQLVLNMVGANIMPIVELPST